MMIMGNIHASRITIGVMLDGSLCNSIKGGSSERYEGVLRRISGPGISGPLRDYNLLEEIATQQDFTILKKTRPGAETKRSGAPARSRS